MAQTLRRSVIDPIAAVPTDYLPTPYEAWPGETLQEKHADAWEWTRQGVRGVGYGRKAEMVGQGTVCEPPFTCVEEKESQVRHAP